MFSTYVEEQFYDISSRNKFPESECFRLAGYINRERKYLLHQNNNRYPNKIPMIYAMENFMYYLQGNRDYVGFECARKVMYYLKNRLPEGEILTEMYRTFTVYGNRSTHSPINRNISA